MACSSSGAMDSPFGRCVSSLKAWMPFWERESKRKAVKLLRVSSPRKLSNTSYAVMIAWDEEEEPHGMMVLEAIAKAVKFRRKVNGLWMQRNHGQWRWGVFLLICWGSQKPLTYSHFIFVFPFFLFRLVLTQSRGRKLRHRHCRVNKAYMWTWMLQLEKILTHFLLVRHLTWSFQR